MSVIDRIRNGAANVGRTIQNGAENVGRAVQTGAQAVGRTVQSGVNVVRDGFDKAKNVASGVAGALNPLGRTADSRYDGQLVGRGGQTFPPNTPLSQIPGVEPVDGRRNEETIIYTNGIQTDKDGQFASLQAIANATGSRVVGVHNATDGFAADLRQCVQDKLDKGTNPAVDTLANTIYNEIKAGRQVRLMGHSQGGLITSRALTHVQQRLRAEDGMTRAQAEQLMGNIRVETFGAAAGHYPDGPRYDHYINRADPVPGMFGLGQIRDDWNPLVNGGRGSQIHWFNEPHLNPIDAHSFESVYLRQWEQAGNAR